MLRNQNSQRTKKNEALAFNFNPKESGKVRLHNLFLYKLHFNTNVGLLTLDEQTTDKNVQKFTGGIEAFSGIVVNLVSLTWRCTVNCIVYVLIR